MATTRPASCGKSTMSNDIHDIQVRYKLSSATMKTLSSLPHAPDRQQILRTACVASELGSFPMKQTERGFFRQVNDHTAIPHVIRENISQPWHKVFLLVQVDLLRTGWPNKISSGARKQLYQDLGKMLFLLDRVLRCIVDIMGLRHDGRGVSTALDVLRSVRSRAWEGDGRELLLVDGIGVAKLDRLGRAGIRTIRQLQQLEFCHIERLLSRNPPFGHQLLQQLAGFPRLSCQFEAIAPAPSSSMARDDASSSSTPRPWICRTVMGYENDGPPCWKGDSPWVTLVIEGDDGRLLWFWRVRVEKLRGKKDLIVSLQTKIGEKIEIRFACEEIVGTMVEISHQMP